MIRIFKLVLLLVVSQVAFGQAPTNYTNINGRYRWIAGMFDSTFHIPKGTTPSLRTGGSTNAGGLFYNTSDSSVYTYTGTQWIKLRGTITDTTSLSNRINLKLNISDTASMLSPYLRKVDTTNKFVTQVYKKNGSDSVFYVRGGNHLWAFNDSTGNPGGGGGGKIYYFNGGVSMGTFGGFTMYELGDTANTGAAANFTRATTGNIANFITDPGKPGLLQIPAGVWTIDAYLSETGGGSNNAEIYVQVEKWDGSTITTIATSPIEQITNGSVIDLYTWSVSIPTTTLAVTDRIIIQFYIQNTNGKTVTLYTQNGYVGEVHTTFTTGIGAINGLTAPAQYLVTGTSGTDFNISSVTATHTFNLPTASATNRGALSSADWTAFNNKGSVSSVATNNATGITGGTITTTGTLAIDTTVISTRLWRQKGVDSVQSNLTAGLALKVNISDTASMLLPYLRKIDTASLSNRINLKVNISDTTSMLSPYLRAIDTASLSNRINLKVNISDTSSMLNPYLRKADTTSMLANYVNAAGYGLSKAGQVLSADSATLSNYYLRRKDSLTATNLLGYVTRKILADTASAIRSSDAGGSVTSVATNNGTGITGGTITTAGTLAIDTVVISTRAWRQKGIDSVEANLTSGLATKLNISDTSSMLTPYLRKVDTASLSNRINLKVNISDTSTMLGNYVNSAGYGITKAGQVVSADSATLSAYYLRRKDSLTSTNLLGYVTRTVLADSAAAIRAAAGGGSVTGSGTATRVAFWNGTSSLSSNADLYWDNTNSRLGIGTTTPILKIDVIGGSTDTTTVGGTTVEQISLFRPSNGTGGIRTGFNTANGDAYIWSANSGSNLFFGTRSAPNNNINLAILSTGNIGIGTTTVGSNLQINGNAAIGYSSSTAAPTNGLAVAGASTFANNITLSASSTNALILQNSSSGESPNVTFITPVNKYNIDANATGNLRFFRENTDGTGGAVRMNLTDGGSLGIGTTTIGSTIQVNGNAAIGYSASTAAPTNGLVVAGNVGIGISNPAAAHMLQINNPSLNNVRMNMTNTSTGTSNTDGLIFQQEVSNSIIKNQENGYLAFGVNGAENNIVIAQGGNVGIGTTTPNAKLQVLGTIKVATGNAQGILGLGEANGATVNVGIWRGAANAPTSDGNFLNLGGYDGMVFAVSAAAIGSQTERMRITSGGTLIVGNGETASSPSTGIISGTGGSGTNIAGAEFRIRGGASTGNAVGGPITFYTSAAGSSGTGVNAAAERMRLDPNGNLGIGTSNPTARLSVVGTSSTAIRIESSTDQALIDLVANNNYRIIAQNSGNAGRLDIFDQTSSATRFSITTSGNVGIGTTTIGSKLQVNGNAAIGYSASTAGPTNGLSISGNTTIGTTTAAGKFTIDPDDNQVGLAVTGTSLTSANAQSLIDLAQTWNTTGNPTAIKLNITNTASGATADLMELQVGGTSQFTVDKSGNTIMTGSVKTGAPSGGTADTWKLGTKVASSVVLDDNNYLEVEVGGVAYRVALVNLAEPEPEAAPLSSPDGYVRNYGPVATVKLPSTSEKVANLEKEIAELRETIKLLKSKIK